MNFVYIWEFDVAAEMQREFLAHYGPQGTWARLFRRAPGYLGTQLLTDEANPHRFLTVDRWASRQAFNEFKLRFAADYEALDKLCDGLSRREASLGSYLTPAHEQALAFQGIGQR